MRDGSRLDYPNRMDACAEIGCRKTGSVAGIGGDSGRRLGGIGASSVIRGLISSCK